jgi:MerR family transcriptional regulator, mercuric resistance operon regulatory protein
MEQMTIGQLAAAASVNVETVRYYQRRGLLPAPEREPGTIARYPDSVLARLGFIKRAQGLGFTLEEVQALLGLQDGQGCAAARRIGEQKLADVRERIAKLKALERSLQDLVSLCGKTSGRVKCPMIEQLLQAG